MNYILQFPQDSTETFLSEIDLDAKFYYLVEEDVTKVYKKDITFEYELMIENSFIVVGAEVLKHLFRQAGVTRLTGTYQRFESKECGQEIKVGCLVDPRIVFTYPEREVEITKQVLSLISNTAVPGEGLKLDLYPLVQDLATFEHVDELFNSDLIAYDLETSSLNPFKGEILGVVIAPSSTMSAYIKWTERNKDELKKRLEGKILVGHNYKFDFKWSMKHGLDLTKNLFHDTIILAYLSGKEKELGLKPLSLKYTPFGFYDQKLQAEKKKYCRIYKCKVADFSYDMLPPEVLGEYACYDGLATHYLYTEKFQELTTKFSQPYDILRGATIEVGLMELNGVPVDTEYLNQMLKDYQVKIQGLRTVLNDSIARAKGIEVSEINEKLLNSPKQLAELIYTDMGVTPFEFTDTGAPSTGAKVIEKIAEENDNPFFGTLLSYRKASKIYNTYLLNFLENLDDDERVRTSFNLVTTASGRLSSGKDANEMMSMGKTINLQNIPSRNKDIKKLIRARPGYTILNFDLKNAELWVVGVLASEPSIIKAFKNGEDIHSSTAVDVFQLDCTPDQVKEKYPEKRDHAKTVNFAVLYLAGPGRIASELGITYGEAQGLINKWFAARPRVKVWLENNIKQVRETGEIVTAFNRYRYAPEVFSSNKYIAEHNVKSLINSLIQSPASDINLIGFCKAMREIRKARLDAVSLALVHDSIVLECRNEEIAEVKEIVVRQIQNVLPFDPPIIMDLEIGDSWGTVK